MPDGTVLVLEEDRGHIRKVAKYGTVSPPIEGLPPVASKGHGGLFGLALDPKFNENRRIYFAYSEPGGKDLGGLAVPRARFDQDKLHEVEVIFRQTPMVTADLGNYGGRLIFAPDGTLLATVGDRFQHERIQDLRNVFGALVRIETDGDPAPGNPFLEEGGADPRARASFPSAARSCSLS